MTNLLEQLRNYSTLVADTGDIQAIAEHKPQDATTNPSLIGAAAKMAEYQSIVDETLQKCREQGGASADDSAVVSQAIDQLSVAFGLEILKIIPGRVSTEVDARLSFDTDATVEKARKLIGLYEEAGISRERILIKIASTWEGIEAARELESEGIHCNLTLLFGLHQAVACAEAGVTLISPFVGRILDWYKNRTGEAYEGADDPGVQSVTSIYNYFKKFGFTTQVMGASFRNIGELEHLAGCDLLTISPALMTELAETERPLTRKLDPETASQQSIEKLSMDRALFDRMHEENEMANEKLEEGIQGFTKALVELEAMLKQRLTEL